MQSTSATLLAIALLATALSPINHGQNPPLVAEARNDVIDPKADFENQDSILTLREVDYLVEIERIDSAIRSPGNDVYSTGRLERRRQELTIELFAAGDTPSALHYDDATAMLALRDGIEFQTDPVPIRVSIAAAYRIVKLRRIGEGRSSPVERFRELSDRRVEIENLIKYAVDPSTFRVGQLAAEKLAIEAATAEKFREKWGSGTAFFTPEEKAALRVIGSAVNQTSPDTVESTTCLDERAATRDNISAMSSLNVSAFSLVSDKYCREKITVPAVTYREFLENFSDLLDIERAEFPTIDQTVETMWPILATSHEGGNAWSANKFNASDDSEGMVEKRRSIHYSRFEYLEMAHQSGNSVPWKRGHESWPGLITQRDIDAAYLGEHLSETMGNLPEEYLDLNGSGAKYGERDLRNLAKLLPEPIKSNLEAAIDAGLHKDEFDLEDTKRILSSIATASGVVLASAIVIPLPSR